MPTLTVNGKSVTVDDSFMSLPKEQQDKTIDEIAGKTGAAPAKKPGQVEDFFKSIPGGIVRGVAGFGHLAESGRRGLLGIGDEAAPEEREPTSPDTISKGVAHQPETFGGKVGSAIGEGLGSPTTYVGGGGLGAKMLSGVGGAVGGEVGGALTGDSAAGRIAGGVLGGLAPRGLNKMGSGLKVDPERQAAIDALAKVGIKPSAGDVSGRPWLQNAEKLGDRFGGGKSYDKVKDPAIDQFSSRANEKMGGYGPNADPAQFQQTEQVLGNQFEQATKNLKIDFSPKLEKDLDNIQKEVAKERLGTDIENRISAMLDRVTEGFEPSASGTARAPMTGTTYHGMTQFESPLRRLIDEGGATGYYGLRIRKALDDALEKSSTAPNERAALTSFKDARKKWHNMLTLKEVAAGAEDGRITPDKLKSALTSSKDRKLQYAAGQGDLHDLARAGSRVMTPKSGGGGSLGWGSHAAGFGLGAGVGHMMGLDPASAATAGAATAAAGPAMLGRAVNSHPLQALFKGDTPKLPVEDRARAALRGGAASLAGKKDDKEKRRLKLTVGPKLYDE